MRWIVIGLAAASSLFAGNALAEDRGDMLRGGMMRTDMRERMMARFSPEDVEAFTDARIAALRAGLKLSPDQERMWPSVEDAMRGLVKLRRDQMRAAREGNNDRGDVPGMLRSMADRQAARAEGLRRLADAAAPLYASFDDGQKRRLRLLVRHMRPHVGMGRHMGGFDRGRGFDRDHPDGQR